MSANLVTALQQQLGARLIETHISWVLLDGRHAWKIKKPVRLSFLDFSSLAERRRLCEVELTLNRRLAPELYLGVQPITGSEAAPVLGGAGEPIEYALCMQQFAPGALLSERLAAGTLRPADLDRLAGRMAAFHRTAAVAPAGSGWGSPERIRQPLTVLLDGLMQHGHEAACQVLRPWLQAEAERLHTTWLQRQADGWVIEGHGDLHLANAVVLGEDVTAFDCIEFDPALRWIDGLSDIAFMVMDLMAHGRRDLGWRFLNAYLDERGDHAGLPVLRYYLVYRALVRAVVALLRGDQQGAQREGSVQASPPAPDYLGLALALTRRGQPRLMITHGVSGSGKTHVSQDLLAQAGAVRLRADVIRKQLAGLAPRDRAASGVGQGLYGAEATRATYTRLRELGRSVLAAGYPLIVDATFLNPADRAAFRQLAQEMGLPFHILHCQAPEPVLRARILARHAQGQDASDADLGVLAAQLQLGDGLLDEERACTLTVDASQPWSVSALAASWLGQVPGEA